MRVPPFDYAGSTALVTGASRGIGAEIARELARRGIARLVLTARSQTDLEALADSLRADYPRLPVVAVPADLADPAAPAALRAEMDRRGVSVDLLVNNAGFGTHGFFDSLAPERERAMIALHVDALVQLTRLCLPEMIARGQGGILNIASTAAFVPVPFMATYAATKAFVLSFSEALWAEARERGGDVRVVCLCPGGTETSFGAVVGTTRGRFEERDASTPTEVAAVGLDALDRRASFAVVGTLNYLASVAGRLVPRAMAVDAVGTLFRPADAPGPSAMARATRRRLGIGALAVAGIAALGYGIRQALHGRDGID